MPQLGPDAVIDPDYVVSANMFMEMLEKERINEEGKREKVRERERRKS